jgi:hypothetical protein
MSRKPDGDRSHGVADWMLSDAYVLQHSMFMNLSDRMRSPVLNVLEEEWDLLLILDACRYDYFKAYNTLEGELERRESLGCCTVEWIRNTFGRRMRDALFRRERSFPEIVYVSANPFISGFMLDKVLGNPNPFFKVDRVWDYGWDEGWETVLPDTVTDRVMAAVEEHPDKRVIAHYMQPHSPYITSGEARDVIHGWDEVREDIRRGRVPGDQTFSGEIRLRSLLEAYVGNLRIVLDSVSRLTGLSRDVRITADHGECLGENVINVGRVVGHPNGVHTRVLREVPWFKMRTKGSEE